MHSGITCIKVMDIIYSMLFVLPVTACLSIEDINVNYQVEKSDSSPRDLSTDSVPKNEQLLFY